MKQLQAEVFMTVNAKKYGKPSNFKYSAGPDPLRYRNTEVQYCQYKIVFNDDSSTTVIMTNPQYYGLRRSLAYKDVRTIGGEGYRIPKTPLELEMDRRELDCVR
jgi:hypothetical protein